MVAVTLFIGTFAQAAAGTGLGLISGGVMVLILGREPAIVLLAIVSIPMMSAVLVQNRKTVEWKKGSVVALAAVTATPFVAAALRPMNDSLLLVASGAFVLASVALLFLGFSSETLTGNGTAVFAGGLSAVMNMLSSSGGPPPAIYAVNSNWSASATRGTLQLVFLPMAFASILSLGVPTFDSTVVIVAVAASVVGTGLGMVLARRIPAGLARASVLSLAGTGGLLTLSSGVTALI